jgi:hypothetical protein
MNTQQRCQDLLNALFEYGMRSEFSNEMHTALELFSIATGKINDDDPFYEQRMFCFQEYFLFDYRLSAGFSGSTVFETFLYNGQQTFSLDEMHDYEQFRNFSHSLFNVEEANPDCLKVTDLLSQQKEVVFCLPDYSFAGFDINQIFEGRMVRFYGQSYFTGAFILHPKQVRQWIQKHAYDFLKGDVYCKAETSVHWRSELEKRQELLSSVTEKRLQLQQTEKRKAIDILNVTRKLAEMPHSISSQNLVMALSNEENISPFVPETPFYDPLPLLQRLAYYEVKMYRYKHIDPTKIYALEAGELLNVPDLPKVNKKSHIPIAG